MDKNGVIEFRCKKCGRHFWDYLIQNDDGTSCCSSYQ